LSLAGARQSGVQLERQVTNFIEYARRLSLDPTRSWLIRADGRAIASCICLESPGRTAMLFVTPVGVAGSDRGVIDLVRHAAVEEEDRGIRLLQVVLPVDDSATQAALGSAGFCELAILEYLECPISSLGASEPVRAIQSGEGADYEWITYDVRHHREFADLVLATYDGSLDCPGLAGLREIDDVIAGHKSSGLFVADRWVLLRRDGVAIACVLLVESPLRPTIEIVYTGVHPEYRGLGVGAYAVRYGLWLGERGGFTAVTLAVDSANHPARRVYESLGFRPGTTRRAMIHMMTGRSPAAAGRAASEVE